MFQSARIKLTAWYVLIIMLISVLFSVVIYTSINRELERFRYIRQLRLEREQAGLFTPPPSPFPDNSDLNPEEYVSAEKRLAFILFLINMSILGLSAIASYFLAGKTLRPIKIMVDEQNQFITDASHEFRTPLTVLRSEIEVNLRDKNLTLPDAKSLLSSNLEEVARLQSLSNNLMELAQYQNINNAIPLQKLSLLDIAKNAVKKITPLAQLKNIKIINKVKNYAIKGNEQSLTELFIILLDNAIKYSHEKTKIYITSHKTDHHIGIAIEDQGIGMNKADMSHIFDRFYRADKSRTKEKTSGYGLGLSIAKKIVESHKGTIQVESRLSKGSVFTITLPILS